MTRLVAGPLLVAAAALACAQPQSPPGGEPDRAPPRVVSVFPEPFDTLTDMRAAVVIRFDERLSERLEGVRELRDAVLVSPVTGDVRVERGRRSLEISVAGGWQRGLVYRVVVMPVLRDLFGNARVEPIELVFSTGAPIPETAVAGLVEDRLTGAPIEAARVEATRTADGIRYLAVTDTSGFFSLRNIPEGTYAVTGWLDQDRDRTPDFQEPQDTAVLTAAARDTVVLELSLLPMDTTAARLLRAEPVDSLRVRLHFDDYFPPGPIAGRATVYRLEDSARVADGRLIHASALDTLLARERAAADTVAAAAPRPPRTAAPALPSQQLVLVLQAPLTPRQWYYAEVEGVTNIRGVPGGDGTARFQGPAPPENTRPDTIPPDTTSLDTIPPGATPPDTTLAAPAGGAQRGRGAPPLTAGG